MPHLTNQINNINHTEADVSIFSYDYKNSVLKNDTPKRSFHEYVLKIAYQK